MKESKKCTIVRSTLPYGCKIWTTMSLTKRWLTTFENKMSRMICRPKLDADTGMWRRKLNEELLKETGMSPN